MQPGRALRAVVALVGCAALALASALPAQAVDLTRISEDPYNNAESQHKTEVEPDTFSFGSTVVSTFQVARWNNGGANDIGWATSNDNGVTWKNGFLEGITTWQGNGVYDRVSDPSIAFDALHKVWLISSLALTGPNPTIPPFGAAVLVSRSSTPDGLTWEAKPDAVHIALQGEDLDKNWTVCDNSTSSPKYGTCWTVWDDHGHGNLIQISTSIDGGVTWSDPVTTADRATGLGGQPLVQPGGRLIVPYDQGTTLFDFIRAFVCDEAGCGTSVLISQVARHVVAGGLRAPRLPSAEIDGDGTVYVVWQDCRFRTCPSGGANDIVLSTSTDGLSWSPVSQVPIDDVGSGVDHFIPGIGVDKNTKGPNVQVGLAYYFYPNSACDFTTCQLFAGFISSADGGSTWCPAINLTDASTSLSWIAQTSQGRMVGDYISTSHVADGTAHPVIAVGVKPTTDQFDESMYAPSAGLVCSPGQHRPAAQLPAAAPASPTGDLGVPLTAR